ncbi:MAG: hypothetical protein JNM44_07385 [Chitinophagaceae bacterium]|nr:hypothetical protein [Chitinophagaceae bacterium]
MKYLFIAVIGLSFMVSSCSKKKTSTTTTGTNNSVVVGNWTFNSMSQSNGVYKEDDVLVATYTANSSNPSGTLNLKSDGTYTANVGYDYEVTFDFGGSTLTDNYNIPASSTSGTYSYDANTKKLTFTGGFQTGTFDVTSLSSSALTMKIQVSSISYSGGVKEESANTTTFNFSK